MLSPKTSTLPHLHVLLLITFELQVWQYAWLIRILQFGFKGMKNVNLSSFLKNWNFKDILEPLNFHLITHISVTSWCAFGRVLYDVSFMERKITEIYFVVSKGSSDLGLLVRVYPELLTRTFWCTSLLVCLLVWSTPSRSDSIVREKTCILTCPPAVYCKQ